MEVNVNSEYEGDSNHLGAEIKEEDAEEELPHAEVIDIFQEGLAMLVQDPLLCDLPIQVTLEEINSQIALEFGQAMTVRVCKADGEVMPVVVIQNATVLDLKRGIQRYVQLKHQREGGIQHISWKYVWKTYQLSFSGEKLDNDEKSLREQSLCYQLETFWIGWPPIIYMVLFFLASGVPHLRPLHCTGLKIGMKWFLLRN